MRIEGIPDELNQLTLVKEAKDIEAVVRSAHAAQQMIGNSIRIPGEGASDAERTEFRAKAQRLGLVPRETFHEFVRPEKPEGYEIKTPPADTSKVVTQAEIDGWKAWAHKQGFSAAQFEAYAVEQINGRIASAAALKTRGDAARAKVVEKFGPTNEAQAHALARAAAERFNPALIERLGADPDGDLVIALAEVGKLFGERAMGDLSPRQGFGAPSPEEATMRLSEIANNKDHPHNKPVMSVGTAAYDLEQRKVMNLRRVSMGLPELKPNQDYMFEESA